MKMIRQGLFFLITILMFIFFISRAYSRHSDLDSITDVGKNQLMNHVRHKKSCSDYAKNIEVECYIVTRQQLSDLFNQKITNITQLPTKELNYPQEVYFLIRVKNTGNMATSGILHCFVPSCGFPYPIKVMYIPPKMDDYYDFVIRFDTGLISPWDSKPVITYEWNKLECYP